MNQLYVGLKYRNFKEACIRNGLIESNAPNPRGNTRKRLEKELSTLFKWHKVDKGNAIIVDEIYVSQQIKEDKRRCRGIYIDSIAIILMYLLKDIESDVYVSVNKLIKWLDIFNGQYFEIGVEKSYEEIAIEMQIDTITVKAFKMGSKREVQRIIERALKSMKLKKNIDYVQGRFIVSIEGDCRLATSDELQKIKKIEQEELNKLKCRNLASLRYKNLESLFFDRVKKRFQREGLEYIEYTFYGYHITSYDKIVSEQIKESQKDAKVIELRALVRNRLMLYSVRNNERAIQKAYERTGFGEPILEFDAIASGSYIPSFKKAIDTFM